MSEERLEFKESTVAPVPTLEKEKMDVLTTLQTDISVNSLRKSSKGIQNSPSSSKVSPSRSLSFCEMSFHSADLESSRR